MSQQALWSHLSRTTENRVKMNKSVDWQRRGTSRTCKKQEHRCTLTCTEWQCTACWDVANTVHRSFQKESAFSVCRKTLGTNSNLAFSTPTPLHFGSDNSLPWGLPWGWQNAMWHPPGCFLLDVSSSPSAGDNQKSLQTLLMPLGGDM